MDFKNNISTTLEQSKRLLELGVKPETADMYYWYEGNPYYFPYSLKVQDKTMPYELREEDVPSWSLARLLEMMPHSIKQSSRPNADLDINTDGECWVITYEELGYDIKYQVIKHNLFDALVDMIKYLIGECYFNQDYLIHSNSSKTGKEDNK